MVNDFPSFHFKTYITKALPRRAEVMFPFKRKYSPPVNESEAKRPRTDGQTSATEHQATGKIKPTVALPSPYCSA